MSCAPCGNSNLGSNYVNDTVFVDAKFGNDLTGKREDRSRPFKTLHRALQKAHTGDTIYVNPGEYKENNLILRDKINWYFTLGSSINNTVPGTAIFINYIDVATEILGYGDFTSSQEIVRQSGGTLNLTLEGQNFTSNSNNMFYLLSTSTNQSKIVINGNKFTAFNILYIQEYVDIVFNFVSIDINKIVYVDSTANGRLIMAGNTIDRTTTNDSDGFSVNSNSFDLDLNVQNYNSTSSGNGYAISYNCSSNTMKYVFQQMNIIGGVLSATSPPFTTGGITLNVQNIIISYNTPSIITTAPFLFNNAKAHITYNTLTCTMLRSNAVFSFTNSNIEINGQITTTTYNDTTANRSLVQMSGGNVIYNSDYTNATQMALFYQSSLGILIFTGDELICTQTSSPLSIVNYANNGSLTIDVKQITFSHPSNNTMPTINIFNNAGLNINYDQMYVNISTSQNSGNIFNIDGNLSMTGQNLYTSNANAVVFVVNTSSNININLASHLCTDGFGYILEKDAAINIGTLTMNPRFYPGGGAFIISNSANVNVTAEVISQNCDNYSIFGVLGGNLTVTAQTLNQNSNNGYVFLVSGILTAVVSTINVNALGTAFHVTGNVDASITTLHCNNGPANAINLAGINAVFNGYIQDVTIVDGYMLTTISNATSHLKFNNINRAGTTLAGTLFDLSGCSAGNYFITGQNILIFNCICLLRCGNGNQTALTFYVENINESNMGESFILNGCSGDISIDTYNIFTAPLLTDIFVISNNSNNNLTIRGKNFNVTDVITSPTLFSFSDISPSNLYIDVDNISIPGRILYSTSTGNLNFKTCQAIVTNGTNVSAFFLSGSENATLNGNTLVSNPTDTTNLYPVIIFSGNSTVQSNWNSISSTTASIVSIQTNNEVWHVCQRSITGSSYPVIRIIPQSVSTAVPTVGGYMKTAGANAIYINNGAGQYSNIRVLTSTLISTSYCIEAVLAPQNVIMQTCIANNNTNNIVQVPTVANGQLQYGVGIE